MSCSSSWWRWTGKQQQATDTRVIINPVVISHFHDCALFTYRPTAHWHACPVLCICSTPPQSDSWRWRFPRLQFLTACDSNNESFRWTSRFNRFKMDWSKDQYACQTRFNTAQNLIGHVHKFCAVLNPNLVCVLVYYRGKLLTGTLVPVHDWWKYWGTGSRYRKKRVVGWNDVSNL